MLLLPVLAHLSDGVCHVELLENGVHVASGSSVLQTDIATHCMEAETGGGRGQVRGSSSGGTMGAMEQVKAVYRHV